MKRLMAILKPKKTRTPQANNNVRLIVGLRNPGSDYEGTRHNVGGEVVSAAVAATPSTFGRAPRQIRGLIAKTGLGDHQVQYLLPNTFMNESGGPVVAAMRYFKVDGGAVLVVHDDIDLEFGRLRVQQGRGSGGHNGIRSVETALGSNDFWRLKVGVGRPPGSQDPADFVLRPFAKSEQPEVELMVADAADVVDRWLTNPALAQEQAAHRGKDV